MSWRKRKWAMLLWTLAAVVAGIVARFTFARPKPGCFEFCGVEYVLIVFAWLIGLAVIGVVTLLANEVRYRREMRAIAKEREGEERRF